MQTSQKDEIIPGKSSKRALVFSGSDLYSKRGVILKNIKLAIKIEPHILWQFIIRPEEEEPLDLLEDMIHEIRRHPGLWLDRFSHASFYVRVASRRVFVHLKKNRPYSHEWIRAAEILLSDNFY